MNIKNVDINIMIKNKNINNKVDAYFIIKLKLIKYLKSGNII